MIVVHIKDEHDVYGGRPRGGVDPRDVKPGQHGWLGNPFGSGTREENIQSFREWFWLELHRNPEYLKHVRELQGKRVACFCSPKACHLDQVKRWLDAGSPLDRR
jgi:hypothetical protein